MKKIYSTRFIYHLKSLKSLVIGPYILPIFLCLFLAALAKPVHFYRLIFSVAPFVIILFFPIAYLHLSYYLKNVGMKMAIDNIQGQILFLKNGKEYLFKISDIKAVEQNLGIYYQNNQDFVGRRIAPWTSYGYLLLTFRNGSKFYITSLMVDIVNPPLETSYTYFRFFPYLKKGVDISEKRSNALKDYENEISFYRSNFKLHSQEQLKEKIRNKNTYEKAAVEAARQLLKSKFGTIV